MARIVLTVDIAGTRDGKEWPARGSEVDLPDDEAADLIKSGSAVDPDDERVAALRGYVATDLDLAGAPTGRNITEGQPDTNLARARALAGEGDAAAQRSVTRAAAERADYTDELTVPTVATGPTVGDDQAAPTQTPGAAEPNPTVGERDGDDGASGLIEAADASTAGEERAVTRSKPARR